VTKPGTVCDAPDINLDLYPTFLEAAGSFAPEGKTLDGASIVPLLRGETRLAREAIFWHFPGYLDIRAKPTTVIRKGDWKLHLHHEEWLLDGGREKIDSNNAVELYNLADDIGERNNLAAANPAKRDELLDDLLAWIEATGAKMPSETNPEYVPGSSSWQGGARREARNAREAARQEQ